ncbi:putative bifunctional diguanylate cyclase/phosphodiesterase [Exiguobacterium antarcticum]|uniref:Bifunctional diguanylate cyclase/phosphodiesterase n=1 Tax=Exiguobacterium antarcticum TaxID=132920 RepID=A0ABT6QYI7_9BACL|nr:bifunctional diguanylate cyclase/phosphodiesterase [Exiguobacterium antarcticum]AFS71438.1 Diguanylate cyclase/phosphodiesterase with PAS/PAC sensor(S) [Exiguobacterium antarcticum B7]MDI3233650.1 bifunctional diguanylate cyclase/phosphodiesterase [Exiguobacterium antarcticum]
MLRRLSPVSIVEAFRKRSYYKTFSWMILIIGLLALLIATQQLLKNLEDGYQFKRSSEMMNIFDRLNQVERSLTDEYYLTLSEKMEKTTAPRSDMWQQTKTELTALEQQIEKTETDGPAKKGILSEINQLQAGGYASDHQFFRAVTSYKSEILFNQLYLSGEKGTYYSLFSNLFLMEEEFGRAGQFLLSANRDDQLDSIELLRIRQIRQDVNLRNDTLIQSLYATMRPEETERRRDISVMSNQMYAYLRMVDATLSQPNNPQYGTIDKVSGRYQTSMYRLFDEGIRKVQAELTEKGNTLIRNAWLMFIVTCLVILSLLALTLSLLRAFRKDLHILQEEADFFAEGPRQSHHHVPEQNDFHPVVEAFRTMTTIISGLLDYNDKKTIEIKQKKAEIESLFSQNTNPIVALSSDFQLLSGNDRFKQLAQSSGLMTIEELIHPADLNRVRRALNRAIEGYSQTIRCQMIFKEDIRNMFVNIIHVPSKNDGGTALYLTCHDETDQFKREERITQLALYDVLTGLLNRNGFEQKMSEALAAPQPGELVTIGVRQFRRINDIYGHSAGDQILKEVSNRLRHHFIGTGSAARIGGDEFAVLIFQQEIVDYRDLKTIIERPYQVDGETIDVNISMSMVRYPDDAVAVTSLLSSVDIAMQHAKREQAGEPIWFESWMSEEYRESVVLESELREAIARNELQLFYQPQVNLKTKEVDGCEALLRWFHPERGMISPAVFIPIAERSILIEEIGMWVVQESVNQVRRWEGTPLGSMRVSANLSVKELVSGRIVEFLTDVRDRYPGIEQRMELEITESFGVFSDTRVFDALQTLHRLGYRLAIDDFGTGYSSLSYLSRLPIQRLKIDRSFISGDDACSNAPLIETIIRLAHTLKYDVVAEGIEQAEQGESLRKLDCEYGQGFYYSRPIPPDEFEIWYDRYQEESKQSG